jgi:hypothetical protein
MIKRDAEIIGINAKNIYEFICTHYTALDGLRLGPRFVSLYIHEPWPELFYEKCDDRSAVIVADYLLDNQHVGTMPTPLKVLNIHKER